MSEVLAKGLVQLGLGCSAAYRPGTETAGRPTSPTQVGAWVLWSGSPNHYFLLGTFRREPGGLAPLKTLLSPRPEHGGAEAQMMGLR